MLALIIILLIVILGYSVLTYLYKKNTDHLTKELRDAQERFKITYELLWMEVRDKNDLTYENMAMHIVSMQKSELASVRDTLAKRIVGQKDKNKVGF